MLSLSLSRCFACDVLAPCNNALPYIIIIWAASYVWDLPTLELRHAILRVHASRRTVSISKWIDTQGVMDVRVTATSTISCGVDGTVKVFSNI